MGINGPSLRGGQEALLCEQSLWAHGVCVLKGEANPCLQLPAAPLTPHFWVCGPGQWPLTAEM